MTVGEKGKYEKFQSLFSRTYLTNIVIFLFVFGGGKSGTLEMPEL